MQNKKRVKKRWVLAIGGVGCAAVAVPFAALLAFLVLVLSVDQQEAPPNLFQNGEMTEYGQNEIPPDFVPIYQAAAEQYGIPWALLAAVHRVETVFSTLDPMLSYAGAEGHFQFMPCTWTGWGHPTCGGLGKGAIPANQKTDPAIIDQYGGFGVDGNGDGQADPWDLTDATYTAAKYLAQNGAANGNLEKAVFSYNHSQQYVSDVLGFMNRYVTNETMELTPGTGGFMRPLNTQINSRYGWRIHPKYKTRKLHGGIDFDCDHGDLIPAAKAGKVVFSGWMDPNNPKSGYGLYVWVDHGGGYKTTYAHLSRTIANVGDVVRAGDVVGACGTTGTSTGNHLHFEIFKNGTLVDPAPYLGL